MVSAMALDMSAMTATIEGVITARMSPYSAEV
jgi:hypothetical protein